MTWLYSLLASIVLIYAVKAVVLYRRQGEHIYNPRRDFIGTPTAVA